MLKRSGNSSLVCNACFKWYCCFPELLYITVFTLYCYIDTYHFIQEIIIPHNNYFYFESFKQYCYSSFIKLINFFGAGNVIIIELLIICIDKFLIIQHFKVYCMKIILSLYKYKRNCSEFVVLFDSFFSNIANNSIHFLLMNV